VILLSWPRISASGDLSLDLVGEVLAQHEVSVSVMRGTRGLTGRDIAEGHECLYRGGMWTVRKSVLLDSVTRRNASVKYVAKSLLADMQSHSMCYNIPLEVLEGALSVERMDELCLALEVMRS
jgi:hypothetical protein